MALFVGRIPEHIRPRDLEDSFIKYGRISRCDIKRGGKIYKLYSKGYGFVEFDDVRDAEDALRDGRFQIDGHPIVVEWAKGSGRRSNSDECFRCGRTGHWARDCPSGGGRGGSPSRSSRSSRYRSRSRERRRHSRSPSRSYSRSPQRSSRRSSRYRSRSRSASRPRHHRYERRHPSRSRSVSRHRYASRSPSPRGSSPCRSPQKSSNENLGRSRSGSSSPRGRSRDRSPPLERSISPSECDDQM